jgi:mono/diheme cytochrome c family protein
MHTYALLALLVACGGTSAADTAVSDPSTATSSGTDTSPATDTSTGTASGTSTGTGSEGAALYATYCAGCHGADGGGGTGPSLGSNVGGKSDDALRTLITEGQGYMPPIGIPAEDIPALIAYLRATFG